ncbi:aspartate aminotransferase family protein [Natribacillus halophilus]|uniref:Adenosylmethionine-8-amino-7-oxononanoate aminotransferase n=1 Tax=Natribacillus halophilus TaxID=549003 RepID=A0A1G8SFC2_9BACI|nr:aspartate aminotransferase family protein [Natribacillus halophilus]SDJ27891.1 Adenosylmethionine-8-amino-7-oxononanoate aminotransferase [Natribacillus halophilus]
MTDKHGLQQLKNIDRDMILHPQSTPKEVSTNGPSMIFSTGEGIRFTDMEGKTYIDGVSMLWNVNLGHGNKELAQASYDQMSEMAYGSQFYGNSNEPAIRLAEKIVDKAPEDLNSVFYTSGGSESNDSAFKFARFYWQLKGYENKKIIISLKWGYHGVTISTQRATGIKEFRAFSGSSDPYIYNAIPHLTAAEQGDRTHPDYEKSIRGLIEKHGSNNVAAVIIEPIQGAGGVHIAPDGYLEAVKVLCEDNKVLFISDEVICGFGRTGKHFGVDHWGIVPDMITFAKGVTSGYFPLGGVILSDEIKQAIDTYDQDIPHGFTYSGHPTGCAVGLKNLEIIDRDELTAHAAEMGVRLQQGFDNLEKKHSTFTHSRTVGLLGAFELMRDRENGVPFKNHENESIAGDFVSEGSKRGLLIRSFDYEEGMNILAVAPPIIITKEEVDEVLSILDDTLSFIEEKWLSL